MRFLFTSARRFLVVAALLFFSCHSLCAQTNNGGITGSILDSSGAAVAGAEVTATGAETHTIYTTTSTASGAYRFGNLVLGTYNITVTAKGFKTANVTGVVVQINTVASLDITLQPGEVKETLTVVADAPRIQTETSEIGTVVDTKEILELPLSLNATSQSFLRSPETFVFLTPGTQGPGTNQNGSASAGIFQSKLSGGQNFSTEVLLDGASTTRSDSGSAFDQTAPSVEALSEFKVLTSTFSAQFGRTSGGIESFATKSGGNDFHGTAFDLFRNTALDANSWNKTFFFFSWEQYRNNPGTSSLDTLPTKNELQNGDFSALLGSATGAINPCDNTAVLRGQIFDPTTTSCPTGFVGGRIAFPGNKITNLSPVAQKVLSFLTVHPDPARGLTNNFTFNSTNPIRDTTMSFRIDENWGNSNKFFFSYSSRDQEQFNGTQALPPPLDTNFFKSRFSHYLRFGWDKTFSSSLLNHFNIGFNRLYNPSKADSFTGQDWPKTLGIPGAGGVLFPQFTFHASSLNIGYQGFSAGNFDVAIPNGLIVADSVSWIKARHAFRFGFEWRASQFSRFNSTNTSPNYEFSNFQTAFAASDPQTGDPFASFLLGLPQDESAHFSSHVPRWNQNYYAPYVQDDFKFRKNLTFNLGFRYDVDTPRHEAYGAQSVLDLNTPNPGAGGTLGALIYGPNATGAKTYYKNFGPRIGFAYAPEKLFGRFSQMVIRGGYS